MVDETAAVETLSAFAIEGRDGSRIFVAKDPTAASAARTMMRADIDDRAAGAARSLLPSIFCIVMCWPLLSALLYDAHHIAKRIVVFRCPVLAALPCAAAQWVKPQVIMMVTVP